MVPGSTPGDSNTFNTHQEVVHQEVAHHIKRPCVDVTDAHIPSENRDKNIISFLRGSEASSEAMETTKATK